MCMIKHLNACSLCGFFGFILFILCLFGFGFCLDQMKIINYMLVNNLRFKTKMERLSFCFYVSSSFRKHYSHIINSQCFHVI